MITVSALVFSTVLTATGNLLVNPGFDTGLDGWQPRGASGAVLEASQAEEGNVFHIVVPDEVAVGWPCLAQSLDAQPGDFLEATVRARVKGIRDGYGAYMAIEHINVEGTRVSWTQSEAVPLDVNDWVPLAVRSVVPEQAVKVNLVLILNGHGEAWFDDASLSRQDRFRSEPITGRVTLTVSQEVVCPRFFGFGVEDDGWFYSDINSSHGISEEDITLRESRIEWTDPDWVRMFFWHHDWCPSHDWETFAFDSENMQSHYRTLEVYQRIGAKVNVVGVEWGIDRPYAEPEKVANAIGALLEHLVRVRGFQNIAAWTLTNEPNGSFLRAGGSFSDYARLHRLVQKEFERRGLDIRIVGSDDAQGLAWFRRCAEDPEYSQTVDLWSSHRYFRDADRFLVPYFFEDRKQVLREHALTQPFIMAELGFQDIRSTHLVNPIMETYPYALWTAALCLEGLNRGAAGFSIWCLHEVYYPGPALMNYGLWNFKDRGWETRPVYHAWSMFCRLTEAGEPVYRCESSHPHAIRGACVGDTLFWVNEADVPATIVISGFAGSSVRTYTQSTLHGDRECGTASSIEEDSFRAPARSFGYVMGD